MEVIELIERLKELTGGVVKIIIQSYPDVNEADRFVVFHSAKIAERNQSYFKTYPDAIHHLKDCIAELEEPTYSVGDRFEDLMDGEKYILSLCGDNKVLLTNLSTGGLWDNPVKVADITKITESELSHTCDLTRFKKTEE